MTSEDNQLPAELDAIVDTRARALFATKPELIKHTLSMYQSAERELKSKGLSGSWQVTTFTDPESIRGPMLVIECRIKGKSYAEILDIWTELSLKTSQGVPLEARKQIALVLEDEHRV